MNKRLVIILLTLNFYKSKAHQSNELCDTQLEYIEQSFSQGALWAKIMRDSWGSFPSGIYSGNYYDFGNFDQCIKFFHTSNSHGDFHGQHCTVTFPYKKLSEGYRGKFAPTVSQNVNIGIGICVPHTCSPEHVMEVANLTLIPTKNLTVGSFLPPELLCSTGRKNIEFNGIQIFAIIFFSTFLLFAILSTTYEIFCEIKNLEPSKIFCVFSINSNLKLIMSMKPLSSKEMKFIHGIRALAAAWIVICHTYSFYLEHPIMNSNDYFTWIQNFSSMIFYGGFMGVDTFFVLSAMLMTLSVFRELDKSKKINLFGLYIKRYLRITAPLAALVLLAVSFFEHISDGPLWNVSVSMALVNQCKSYWWTTLLYVGNYVNPGKLCVGHAWYLMVDMQLYFLSPFILYPMWKYQKRIWIWILVIISISSISMIYVFVTMLKFGFRESQMHELAGDKNAMIYTATHTRIDSWMIGILTGLILYKCEEKKFKFSKKFVTFAWILSIFLILAVTFAQYPLLQENFDENPQIVDAAYETLKRVAWCLAICWIIIACKLGFGGIIKRFLSLPIFLPLSKLSFSIYLTHVLIMLVYMSSMRSPQYFSNFIAIYKFFGDYSMAIIFATILALIFEYPTLRIIKILESKIQN